MKTLRLILGDQLNSKHSWFKEVNQNVTYVLMEVKSETSYVQHHIQKVVAFFASMRNFANELKVKGHQVLYIQLDNQDNKHKISENIIWIVKKFEFDNFEYQLPDEYRLDKELKVLSETLAIPTSVLDTEHFFTTRSEFQEFFKGKKKFLMESFYRYMRKKHSILMEGNQPIGEKWNFDHDNRKKIPANHTIIQPFLFKNDVSEIVDLLKNEDIKTIGTIESNNFLWPVSRKESIELLDFFVDYCLSFFGTFQDAMTPNSWSLYHSRISFAMNVKMISPKEVIDKVIERFQLDKNISINQVEGFVRQILGWREYMRGIYWSQMPDYKGLNYFNHERKLPSWFWDGQTKMKCLSHAINQSLDFAYAHHIQRLMITGNFALLAGIHPDEVDDWYLGIYIDAIEWVEITNTRGMSQFADGGIVGSKPYVSSAAYINKMSHYCKGCHYDAKKKIGEESCPFNSLYWNFYAVNEEKLRGNPRIGMMYVTWDKMDPTLKQNLLNQATEYLGCLNDL